MAFYESVFIARQDIAAPQVETLTENITKIIEGEGGSVQKTEYWGLRSLAYRIKKNRKGHYVLLNVDSPASAIAEMERQMRINEDVLRYMTIRVDELEEGPSAIMRNRGSEDRPRRPRDEDGDASSADTETAAKADVVEDAVEEVTEEAAPVEEAVADDAEAEDETKSEGDA
jgi:small subunit ribosomal protein S6